VAVVVAVLVAVAVAVIPNPLRNSPGKHTSVGVRNPVVAVLRWLTMRRRGCFLLLSASSPRRRSGHPVDHYYVYIMGSWHSTTYTGVTNDLQRRVAQHKEKAGSFFTSRYNVTRLLYFEEMTAIQDAIAREKEIKGWRREKKGALIESMNPDWEDLSDGW
jgi:putative endonuclease